MSKVAPRLSTTTIRRLHVGKLIQFIFCTICFGLLQLWITAWIVVDIVGKPAPADVLLGNGGLFFFATSLLVTSAMALHGSGKLRDGSRDLLVTLLVAVPTFLLAIITYSAVVHGYFAAPIPTFHPFGSKVWHQITAAGVATTYAIYAVIRTGQVTK